MYRLAPRLLSPVGAVATAALFAVHPVHVEATANVVGQGELWMTLFVLLACPAYLDVRRTGAVPALRQRLVLGILLVLASASKEQGLVLPGLIVLIEFMAVGRSESFRTRLAAIGPTLSVLLASAVGMLLGRYLVLGKLGQGAIAAQLDTLDLGQRVLVMSPMIAEWIRLLVWPRHLETQYSPPAYGAMPATLTPVVVGLGLLVTLIALAVLARRSAPTVTLGLAWTGCALLPVANIFFPTGIVIAERTLFLPSVGAILAGVAAGAWAAARAERLRPVFSGVLATLIVLGSARSFSRQAIWRDTQTTLAQTVIDGPRSYRGFQSYGMELAWRGNPRAAIPYFARAAALYQGDRRVFEDWGQALRRIGRCDEAIAVLTKGLAHHSDATVMRSRLFECLMATEQYREALDIAERGVSLGQPEFEGAAQRARARLRSE